MKFTPGPWIVRPPDGIMPPDIWGKINGKSDLIAVLVLKSGWEFNARLIVAAPDMFAILKEIESGWPQRGGGTTITQAVLETTRRIIEKVEREL